jgi:predicted DNA-binding transcriptional regulator AlpA
MTRKEPKEKGKCGVPEGYLGIADVQKLLNKCRATIWKMINEGRLPKPLRDGKLRIWDEKEIRMWIYNAKFCTKKGLVSQLFVSKFWHSEFREVI